MWLIINKQQGTLYAHLPSFLQAQSHIMLQSCLRFCFVAPPEIVASKSKYTATVGSQTILKCDVVNRGVPPASFGWKKDANDLTSDYQISSNQSSLMLKIPNVTIDNAGEYVCTATTKSLYRRDFVTLIVEKTLSKYL